MSGSIDWPVGPLACFCGFCLAKFSHTITLFAGNKRHALTRVFFISGGLTRFFCSCFCFLEFGLLTDEIQIIGSNQFLTSGANLPSKSGSPGRLSVSLFAKDVELLKLTPWLYWKSHALRTLGSCEDLWPTWELICAKWFFWGRWSIHICEERRPLYILISSSTFLRGKKAWNYCHCP